MDAPEGRPAAPDLFTALRLVPMDPSAEPAAAPAPVRARRSTPVRTSPPSSVAQDESAAAPAAVVKPAAAAPPPPSSADADAPKYRGLADLLEPDLIEPVEQVDSAFPLVELPAPQGSRAPGPQVVPPVVLVPPRPPLELPSELIDAELEPRRRGMPWGWIGLSLMLASALGWVLYTQTDLFHGDVIANRDAKALAEAEAELEQAEAARKQSEYGSLQLDSKPDGARVWLIHAGPEAQFPNLPIGNEYMVFVAAPGHQPRVRLVKGSELSSPVVMDLDPAPNQDALAPLPEERVPKLAQAGQAGQPGTLVLRSNTPGAELGLLVGYTPGVKVVDLDVGGTHHFRLTKTGFESHDVVVKGRHWEEVGGNLVYSEHVELRALVPAGEDETLVIEDVGAAAAPADAPPPAPAAAAKKKKKKKKKKK